MSEPGGERRLPSVEATQMIEPAGTERATSEGDPERFHADPEASRLWNPDLAPTSVERRTWSTWNIAALWIGMSVAITTYTLAGGLVEAGMTWWQAMLTILLGNTIVLIPMILNAHAGTKYGVSFPVLARVSFGTRGANLPALARALVACGWFGIQTWIGATALDALVGAMWRGWTEIGAGTVIVVSMHRWIAFLVFWGLEVALILRGIDAIKHLTSWSAPVLLFGGVLLLVWASSRAGGLGHVLAGTDALRRQQTPFWSLFPGALTASVGYWATLSLNIPDFTRYARSQRAQALGQALGLPLTMTAIAFVGVAVTSATIIIFGRPIPDPIELVTRLDSLPAVLFATLVIVVAQLTMNMSANVVSPSNDFSNLSPGRISYVTGGMITAVVGLLMMPWKLLDSMGSYIFTWLVGYSGLMGAIAGIMICDYWVLRRRRVDVPALFDPRGRYSYRNGWNGCAVLAFFAAVAPAVPGFFRAAMAKDGHVADPGLFDTLYTYSWFVTFALGFAVYYALMRRGARAEESTGHLSKI
jgi:NCS1 family nucleobase:cation symporter-1